MHIIELGIPKICYIPILVKIRDKPAQSTRTFAIAVSQKPRALPCRSYWNRYWRGLSIYRYCLNNTDVFLLCRLNIFSMQLLNAYNAYRYHSRAMTTVDLTGLAFFSRFAPSSVCFIRLFVTPINMPPEPGFPEVEPPFCPNRELFNKIMYFLFLHREKIRSLICVINKQYSWTR